MLCVSIDEGDTYITRKSKQAGKRLICTRGRTCQGKVMDFMQVLMFSGVDAVETFSVEAREAALTRFFG